MTSRGPLLIAGFVASASCTLPEQGRVDVRWLDRTTFDRDVQPILAARCASPQCHGHPARLYSIFAPLRFRADPERVSIDEPLSREELTHNYVASCVAEASADPIEAPWLMRKALGERGGVFHGGGVVFDDVSDPDYATLASWMAWR